MVSHDVPTDPGSEALSAYERQQRTLQRLDDGHSALLDALKGLDESDAFLGSRWSVWEVMQHLLTENFVEALEQIASGEREMLPAFDARTDRIAADVAKLEANYQRFRKLISGLTEEQLDLPATPYNPENNYPALSLLDLIERVSGHEGNHARQVVETRKYVAAFRSAQRAVTVAGLGTGSRDSVPTTACELLSNADYVIGTQAALARADTLGGERALHREELFKPAGPTPAPPCGPWCHAGGSCRNRREACCPVGSRLMGTIFWSQHLGFYRRALDWPTSRH